MESGEHALRLGAGKNSLWRLIVQVGADNRRAKEASDPRRDDSTPVIVNLESDTPSSRSTAPPPWEGRKLVLVLEDDPDTAASIRDALQGAGYAVNLARDGVSAMRMLRLERELSRTLAPENEARVPNLILLELELPAQDAFGFYGVLRGQKDFERVPVVLMTRAKSQWEVPWMLTVCGDLDKTELIQMVEAWAT